MDAAAKENQRENAPPPKRIVTNSVAACLSAAGRTQLHFDRFGTLASDRISTGNSRMRKTLPSTMFSDPERSRLSMLRTWVLDNEVTEIEMNERQFWNFAQLLPIAEKPWATYMGRVICVPDMPAEAQKYLGIVDKRNLGAI
jgi:hypothetical protein